MSDHKKDTPKAKSTKGMQMPDTSKDHADKTHKAAANTPKT